jgi:hypothetical protein
LKRDGMALELYSDSILIAEIFYSDQNAEYSISVFEKGLPLAVLDKFVAAARARLAPR